MKKIFILIATAAFLTACGDDSRAALKETGAALGKLGVTTVVDGAQNVAETGIEVAKGTGGAIADEVGKGIDKASELATATWDMAAEKVEEKVDQVKKEVK